ncbi:jg22347, partial [Pararge aegeria aegeria]
RHSHSETQDVEKNVDRDDKTEKIKDVSPTKPCKTETSQSCNQKTSSTDEKPVSTTTEEIKSDNVETNEAEKTEEKPEEEKSTETESSKDAEVQDKASDAEAATASPKSDIEKEQKDSIILPNQESPVRKRSLSAEKSEILELHAEESRCETSEGNQGLVATLNTENKIFPNSTEEKISTINSEDNVIPDNNEDKVTPKNSEDNETPNNAEIIKSPIKNDIEHDKSIEKELTTTPDSTQDGASKTETVSQINKENSQTTPDIPNGEITPMVINRKRRWGSRPSKLTSQKSITISTDVLKEIIPDVKPAEFDEVIEEKKHKRIGVPEKIDRPILPKIIIDNTDNVEVSKKEKKIEDKVNENVKLKDSNLSSARKISIVKDHDSIIARPPSPPRHKQSSILYITNLVRPFTLPQLKNLLQRTGRIVDNGFWIDRIKSKCYVKYDIEDQAVETRHALHGVTWPVSNPKTLHVDFATEEDFDKAKANEESDNAKVSTIPGTVEDWLREQDMKREKGELEKPWERKTAMREWDVGKNEKSKEVIRPDKNLKEERPPEKRRHRTIERSPEP